MQIVINIPDEMYDWYDNGFPDEDDAEKLWKIVKNGTPLPKGHGDLIDRNDILADSYVIYEDKAIDLDDVYAIIDEHIKQIEGE